MSKSKEHGSRRWLVPYLGRKVRQLKGERNALLGRIASLSRQVWQQNQSINQQKSTLEGVINSITAYNTKITNDLIEAHKTIGALRYYVEQYGINLPDELK